MCFFKQTPSYAHTMQFPLSFWVKLSKVEHTRPVMLQAHLMHTRNVSILCPEGSMKILLEKTSVITHPAVTCNATSCDVMKPLLVLGCHSGQQSMLGHFKVRSWRTELQLWLNFSVEKFLNSLGYPMNCFVVFGNLEYFVIPWTCIY